MKRFAWLLVVPWTIAVSTSLNDYGSSVLHNGKHISSVLNCLDNSSDCNEAQQDFIEALNAAHERRMDKSNLSDCEGGNYPTGCAEIKAKPAPEWGL